MSTHKQFKAESKRLLELMINSIYTHKEIFLRELISNASDANDKLNYLELNEQVERSNLKIELKVDKINRLLEISDSGIGMNADELEANLGMIANSGSLAFKQQMEANNDIDVIGQFGVGFYAAFMVAKRVEVLTKRYDSEQAYLWSSEVSDGYTIEEAEKATSGTTIYLYLKDNSEEENYDEYLDKNHLESLVKKYSDYIRYPIMMEVTLSKRLADSDEYTEVNEVKTLNSMVPLWKKAKSEVSEEAYNNFYMNKFNDYQAPLKTIHLNIEGNISFNALLFIPSTKPNNFYTQDYQKGLQLYSRGVFIMDKASDLIGDYFSFVKGLVDSQDLSLNISRELLQHDRQLKLIAKRIEKKIKSELLSLLTNERKTYEEFYNNFGLNLKYGVYQDFGTNKDLLVDLLMFNSSKGNLVTLKEYVDNMQADQTQIYYASGESIDKLALMPQTSKVLAKGYEVLYLVDNVDEFALQSINTYLDKSFKNINQGELDLDTEEEKAELAKSNEEYASLLSSLKTELSSKVQDVRIANNLVEHPVSLVSAEGLSFEMEKILSQMPDSDFNMQAGRILELNVKHPIIQVLANLDSTRLGEYADLLYDQALLIAGFNIENPLEFSNKLCNLMIEANKK